MIKNIKIPIAVTGILLISSFLPFIQVIIIVVNGGFLGLLEPSSVIVHYLFNGIFSLIMLLLYIKSKSNAQQISAALGFVFFFFSLLSYGTDNVIPDDPYFFRVLILGALTGVVLILVAFLQNRVILKNDDSRLP
ncbi:MAG: hypothetical protein ACI8XB_002124 [Patiriisocius sp.]|jgi:hypothetical protein